jgi:hypothetical protein
MSYTPHLPHTTYMPPMTHKLSYAFAAVRGLRYQGKVSAAFTACKASRNASELDSAS